MLPAGSDRTPCGHVVGELDRLRCHLIGCIVDPELAEPVGTPGIERIVAADRDGEIEPGADHLPDAHIVRHRKQLRISLVYRVAEAELSIHCKAPYIEPAVLRQHDGMEAACGHRCKGA